MNSKTLGKKKRKALKVWAIIKLTRLFIWKHIKLLGDIMEHKTLNFQLQYILQPALFLIRRKLQVYDQLGCAAINSESSGYTF